MAIDYEKINQTIENKKIELLQDVQNELVSIIENLVKMGQGKYDPVVIEYEKEITDLNIKINDLKERRDYFKALCDEKDIIIGNKNNKILSLQTKIDKLNAFIADISTVAEK